MVLYGNRQQQYGGMFRFDNYLARSPEFIPSVQNIWQHNIIGTPMYAVTRKLKALKPIFREQRRNKGDLSHNVQMAKGFLEAAQILVSSSRRDELYIQLEHCCRLVLAKATKLEQIMLQQRAKMQWMKFGDQCSRVFFRKIAQRRSSRRIFQINDDQESTHTDPEEVINVFVTYYQSLLGGDRRRTAIDIRFLKPWARHILSNEESTALLLPFTPADVKQAVFDIDEDKAPGPDGYSLGFFKAAWPIVGQETTSAVLDFFSTGRLLKQINTTLLALIPKVHSPMTVSDFRPIACCNVIYKIIAKLIVQRLSVIMDKLTSPCQAAFVPGRSIGDNIMLVEGLSIVASGVGKPLYPDAIMRACTRLDFARVCVMLDVNSKMPKHIIIMTPDEEGGELPCKIDVEYEWLPPRCTSCMTLGHSAKECIVNKPKSIKPPVNVYVPKVGALRGPMVTERTRDHPTPHTVEKQTEDRGTRPTAAGPNREERGKDITDVDIIEVGNQFIHCRATIRALQEYVDITIVYGATEVSDRRELWASLESLVVQCINTPWLVGGDINAVRDLSEYTWHNRSASPRNLWKRLDRMLTNDTWTLRFPSVFYQCITPRTSDHSPMVVNGDNQQRFGGMFRFDNFLTLSPYFIPSVQSIWQQQIVGVPMFSVTRKLKALKPIFREQRRNKGDLSHNVELARGFLEQAQVLVSSHRQDELILLLEHCSRLVYAKAAELERIMLRQRAKMEWMKGGGDKRQRVMDLRFLRPWARHIITTEEAGYLLEPFSAEGIKKAIFDIGEDRAPGPDGYSSGFYKNAWPVVGQEITKAVLEFFATGKLLKQINSTILTVIPKVHSPTSVPDFRPISCCNVLYKIIAKLIVQKWSVVLDKIISPCQAAFVPGRSTGDNVMLAQELFTGYNQARLPPRCALKVDIRKAYDTVEWDFLLSVLQLFGFPEMFRRWVEECISSPSFSVGMNGKPHGYFVGARGLRQGDPLSPYLFVLVMEALHMGMLQLIEQDMNFVFHWKCDDIRIFQLGFADDLLLFCRANTESVRVFKSGLDRFADWSGLRLNVEKSHIIISRSTQNEICKPKEEGGLGLKDMGTLNRALMCKKLCEVIRCDRTSIWVEWLRHGRLRDDSIWTIPENRGPWGWRKMLRFPRGPNSLGLHESTMLSSVICEGHWHWPLITDMECVEITHVVPRIHGGTDRIIWKGSSGKPTTQEFYRAMIPAGPKVGWISLLSGSLKIPRHLFILWLAILEKLATTDKPWHSHLGCCVLCNEDMVESHNHLFFHCRFSRRCLSSIRRIVRFQWPNRDWVSDIEWGARKWRGKYIINISYRCLLGSCVYHIWRERNLRRFEHEERPPSVVGNLIVEDVRQRILSIKLPRSISTCALYRLWRIPWPVEGSA
ncbi:UNVERIFIED_CONTAM: hypothetical protein Sindi_0098100 [Sesamum indicum]